MLRLRSFALYPAIFTVLKSWTRVKESPLDNHRRSLRYGSGRQVGIKVLFARASRNEHRNSDLRLASLLDTPPTIRGWFATVHKEVGMRYLVTAFVFLADGVSAFQRGRARLPAGKEGPSRKEAKGLIGCGRRVQLTNCRKGEIANRAVSGRLECGFDGHERQ